MVHRRNSHRCFWHVDPWRELIALYHARYSHLPLSRLSSPMKLPQTFSVIFFTNKKTTQKIKINNNKTRVLVTSSSSHPEFLLFFFGQNSPPRILSSRRKREWVKAKGKTARHRYSSTSGTYSVAGKLYRSIARGDETRKLGGRIRSYPCGISEKFREIVAGYGSKERRTVWYWLGVTSAKAIPPPSPPRL